MTVTENGCKNTLKIEICRFRSFWERYLKELHICKAKNQKNPYEMCALIISLWRLLVLFVNFSVICLKTVPKWSLSYCQPFGRPFSIFNTKVTVKVK